MRAVSAEERHPAVFQRKSQACLCAVLGCTAAPYPCPVVTHSSNPGMGGDANASDTASKGDRTMQLNSTKRRLRNSWIPWVTAIVLACFSNAVAQARYKVQDLGVQHPDNLGMAMGLNNYGWTLTMDQLLDHSAISTRFPAVQGTVRISIRDLNLPLGTLGGKNSSINWNGINDPGEAVGMSETSVLDPNGEDI